MNTSTSGRRTSGRMAQAAVTCAAGSRKDGNDKKDKLSFHSFLVLRTDVPQDFYCVSCGELVIPDYARQAACGQLICGDCVSFVAECSDHSSPDGPHPFTMSIKGSSLQKEIGKVIVRCSYFEKGCKWIGTFSEYAGHTMFCHWSVGEFQHKCQSVRDIRISNEERAQRYENAYYLWSWRGEMINGEPVLSDIRVQARGMCAFVSIAGAFEACLRLKGRKVKHLSIDILYEDYNEAIRGPNALTGSRLKILATILKMKGMVELSPDGGPLKRWRISDFRLFKMDTRDDMFDAIDHIRDNGPLICVHAVTEYQSLNLKSAGIIVGIPSNTDVEDFLATNNTTSKDLQTHSVCSVGFGAEDMVSFLSYQNTAGLEVQKGGYGRMLPCSVLEAVGLIC